MFIYITVQTIQRVEMYIYFNVYIYYCSNNTASWTVKIFPEIVSYAIMLTANIHIFSSKFMWYFTKVSTSEQIRSE